MTQFGVGMSLLIHGNVSWQSKVRRIHIVHAAPDPGVGQTNGEFSHEFQ